MFLCSRERAEEVTRDECVIRFVGVRRGYKAMVECTLERHTEEDTRWWEMQSGRKFGVPWEQDMVECVFEIGKCSSCRSLNLTFKAIHSE